MLSVVEAGRVADLAQIQRTVHEHTGRARLIGLTGPPGAGKSTLTAALAEHLSAGGHSVAVLAIDPSSPFTGGALLGDRVRMAGLAVDPNVFIRSMASRGSLGGLAIATSPAIDVLDAAGFSHVLVETVGVGQSEVDVMAAVETTVLVLAPGMGDNVQAAKAGVIEIADIFVVNKADQPGAGKLVSELTSAQRYVSGPAAWQADVLRTVAVRGEGLPELAAALTAHRDFLHSSGVAEDRRRTRTRHAIRAAAHALVDHEISGDGEHTELLDLLTDGVTHGRCDTYGAARQALGMVAERAARRSSTR